MIILSPQNKATNVPVTKKGPNGNWLFIFFFPKPIKNNPKIAPNKKDKNKATKILGKPKKSPIKNPILASPSPIHLPRDMNQIKKKNPPAPIPANNGERKTF